MDRRIHNQEIQKVNRSAHHLWQAHEGYSKGRQDISDAKDAPNISHFSLESKDVPSLITKVKANKQVLRFLPPDVLQALASQQRTHGNDVEAGVKRGKDVFDPWQQRASQENGEPIEKTIKLATRSTPDKPILPGGVLSDTLERYLIYTLACSNHKMQKIREKIQNGLDTDKALKKVLDPWQYDRYQTAFSSSSTSGQTSRQSDSSADDEQPSPVVPSRETSYQRDSRSSDESLEPIGGDHYFPQRYKYDSKITPFYGETKDGCVIDAAMTILHAQRIYPPEYSLVQHFNPVQGGGFYESSMPSALQAFGSAPYINREKSSVDNLQTIINTSRLPVAACIKNKGKPHMVVVEKIEDHATHGKLICILSLGASYKVTKKDWEAVWTSDEVVPNASASTGSRTSSSPRPQPFNPYGSYGPPYSPYSPYSPYGPYRYR